MHIIKESKEYRSCLAAVSCSFLKKIKWMLIKKKDKNVDLGAYLHIKLATFPFKHSGIMLNLSEL